MVIEVRIVVIFGERLAVKEHERTSWNSGKIPYVDLGGGWMGIHICNNSD